jgi:hypothetical protein
MHLLRRCDDYLSPIGYKCYIEIYESKVNINAAITCITQNFFWVIKMTCLRGILFVK